MYNVCMNQLHTEERTRVIASLVEGNSIRSTVRMTENAHVKMTH